MRCKRGTKNLIEKIAWLDKLPPPKQTNQPTNANAIERQMMLMVSLVGLFRWFVWLVHLDG